MHQDWGLEGGSHKRSCLLREFLLGKVGVELDEPAGKNDGEVAGGSKMAEYTHKKWRSTFQISSIVAKDGLSGHECLIVVVWSYF